MSTGIQLSDDVEPHHHRVDATAYDDMYVVGDVHGCRASLDRLLDRIAPGERDLVVFVGDLVRKGPDSAGVVDLVRRRENFLSVRGNNEEKLRTGDAHLPELDADATDYLTSLPVAISWDDALVVHGGVHPDRSLADHHAGELMTMRAPEGDGYAGPFWYDDYQGPPRVFFGHTVHDDPVEGEWAVGLDTGCVYGGTLTAYSVRDGSFVSVPAAETHQSRSDEKIVT